MTGVAVRLEGVNSELAIHELSGACILRMGHDQDTKSNANPYSRRDPVPTITSHGAETIVDTRVSVNAVSGSAE